MQEECDRGNELSKEQVQVTQVCVFDLFLEQWC